MKSCSFGVRGEQNSHALEPCCGARAGETDDESLRAGVQNAELGPRTAAGLQGAIPWTGVCVCVFVSSRKNCVTLPGTAPTTQPDTSASE